MNWRDYIVAWLTWAKAHWVSVSDIIQLKSGVSEKQLHEGLKPKRNYSGRTKRFNQ